MKKIFFLLFVLITAKCFAADYYVNPTGSNAANGSIGTPWQTLNYALTQVTTAGNTIHLAAGTYNETTMGTLAPGVSLEGAGYLTTILKNTRTTNFSTGGGQFMNITMASAEGTNGNQHITGITFDGDLINYWGINIYGRSNVSVHDCKFVDFVDRGILFNGRNDANELPPTIYATGNTFYNNIVENCAQYNQTLNYGAGGLCIGGQIGMLIYNNTMSQTQRAQGNNGWPIKYHSKGWLKGCKIYNNILDKYPVHNQPGVGPSWNFAIELFNESGLEIYGNTITGGGIDLNYQTKDIYAYSAWIHDNTIQMTTLNTFFQFGITLEFGSDGVIIENNFIDKQTSGIVFTPRANDPINGIIIRKNLMTNIGIASGNGAFIFFNGEAQTNYYNKIDVYNNTMIGHATARNTWGISLPQIAAGFQKNINIKNNIVYNNSVGWLFQSVSSLPIDSLTVTHNNTYGNGNSNNPVYSGGNTPTHYTYANNITTTPTYTGLFLPATGSTLINAGTPVGLHYNTLPDIGYSETGAADGTAPTVTSTVPANSATGASTVNDIIVNVDGALKVETVNNTNFQLKQGATVIPTTVEYFNGSQIRLVLVSQLAANTGYTINVANVQDIAGNAITSPVLNSFTTGALANVPPAVNAGADVPVSLPTTTANLSGTATDADGTISTRQWYFIDGPNTPGFGTPTSNTTTATGLIEGTYRIRFRATDNVGDSTSDTLRILVTNPSNVYTTLNPSDKSATLVLSNGNKTVNDNGGEITGMVRSVLPFPAGQKTIVEATVTWAGAANNLKVGVSTSSGALNQPQSNDAFTRQLAMNGNTIFNNDFHGYTAAVTSGTVITIAYDDVLKTLDYYNNGVLGGTRTIDMTGITGTQYLAIAYYSEEGQVVVNFGASPMQYPVTGYINGIYTTGNISPTAGAGSNQTITLPTSTTTLTGTGNDADGTISAYAWLKLSGPTGGTVTSPASATSGVTALQAGTYQYELTVTDNNGATGKDTVQVTVNAAAPPTVVSTNPVSGSVGVTPGAYTVVINFGTTMTGATLNSTNITGIAGTITPGSTFASIAATLTASTTYTITVGTGVTNASGTAMSAPYIFTFTTGPAVGVPSGTWVPVPYILLRRQ